MVTSALREIRNWEGEREDADKKMSVEFTKVRIIKKRGMCE